MVDIPSVTGLVATAGVFVGVVLAYLEIRNLVRTRKTELFHGIFSIANRREFYEAWEKLRESESLGLEDFKKKYGLVEWNMVADTFNEIGFLLNEKLIDIDAVYKIYGRGARIVWEKMKPLIEDVKKEDPQEVWGLEYLYNEVKKREQRLQQTPQ